MNLDYFGVLGMGCGEFQNLCSSLGLIIETDGKCFFIRNPRFVAGFSDDGSMRLFVSKNMPMLRKIMMIRCEDRPFFMFDEDDTQCAFGFAMPEFRDYKPVDDEMIGGVFLVASCDKESLSGLVDMFFDGVSARVSDMCLTDFDGSVDAVRAAYGR